MMMKVVQLLLLVQCVLVLSAATPHSKDNSLRILENSAGTDREIFFPNIFKDNNKSDEFSLAVLHGIREVEKRFNKSQILSDQGIVAVRGSSTWVHQTSLTVTHYTNTSTNAIAIEHATEAFLKILNSYGVDVNRSCNTEQLFNITFGKTEFGQKYCHAPVTCPTNGNYRTFDGSCNNAKDPLLGKAGTPYARLRSPVYQDTFKLREPRTKGKDGTTLPSAKDVSQWLGDCDGSQDTTHTMMLIHYAQFIDHDISFSPTAKLESNRAPIECCTADSTHKLNDSQLHDECFPIPVNKQYVYDGCEIKRCINFVRTLSAPSTGCTFGPRQQVNDVSHFVDGSNIYGSSPETANSLREFTGGRLLVNKDSDNKDMLPPQTNGRYCKSSPEYCYKAGDSRVNLQPFLALIHTLWVREHNRLAGLFSWWGDDDEESYQKARRLVIAELQHITFNEFLPELLGSTYTSSRYLSSRPAGQYYAGYSPSKDVRVSNEFATAAFKFYHSGIGDFIEQRWPGFPIPTKLPLSSMFFNQELNHFEKNRMLFLTALTQQLAEKIDTCYSTEVTEKLYQEFEHGLDLFAMDIQRGRDHGLPGYVEYRNIANFDKKIYSFEDMDWLSESMKSLLTKAYKNVEDLDLIVGLLLEEPELDASVGPTLQYIIGEQFLRLKAGDRYYYENDRQPFPFTIEQLNAIRSQVSLARIICDNGDGITEIQTNVFRSSQSLVMCNDTSSIPELDIIFFT